MIAPAALLAQTEDESIDVLNDTADAVDGGIPGLE
jgi:hypothetical protein